MSETEDADVEALTSLGLTSLQAKVYLYLLESENATIKDIAKNTGVARQDLYRITSELQNCGLVEQIITKPLMYKAIPITSGVNVLLKDQQRKRTETHKKVAHMLHRHKTKQPTTQTKTEKNHFILVPGKNALILKEKNMLNTTQKTVTFITTKQRFPQKLYALTEELKKAAAKGVKIKILTEKNETEKPTPTPTKPTKNNKETTSCEIRYLNTPPPVVMATFDNKEVIIIAHAKAGLTESPALWSNNQSLLELAQNYFEILWTTATENENQHPQKTHEKNTQNTTPPPEKTEKPQEFKGTYSS
jgi:sugar-specific transcriptional regulator TrmB